jgi:hypothetical protein
MSTPHFEDRHGVSITDWRKWTQPMRNEHWKAGRSAMELARAWFTSPVPVCPPEIQSLLATNPRTAGIEFTEGFPEHKTALPQSGEGRNHDLMLRGHTNTEQVTVCVEAKADEPFGNTIGKYYEAACKASASGDPTQAHKRIEALVQIVFGPTALPSQPRWYGLRYQLLTALAGTAIQAANDNNPLAVLIVHEFQTQLTTINAINANNDDYKSFIAEFCSISLSGVVSEQLYGPVRLFSGHLKHDVDVLIGKSVYKW